MGSDTLVMSGDSTIKITSPTTISMPAGILFTHTYALQPRSYLEVQP